MAEQDRTLAGSLVVPIELQAMIDEFDKDQDGEINEDEFIAIMKQTSLYS